jgi:hypothetical protein
MSNKPERPSVALSENVENCINKALQSSDMIAICEAIWASSLPIFSIVLRILDAMGLQLKALNVVMCAKPRVTVIPIEGGFFQPSSWP